MTSVRDEITNIIGEMKFAWAPVEETSHLYTDLGFDSLAFMYLLVKIEEAYAISIDLMEMDACLRVDKLIALVEKKIKEAGHDSTFAHQSGECR